MNLTEHFTREEFERSQYALRNGINNKMDGDALSCAADLCTAILEPLRRKIMTPITVSSGYRCHELNEAIGGSAHSQHTRGMAADIQAINLNNLELANIIKNLGLPYDQLIYEGDWVHVSHATFNRGNVFTATFKDGKASYSKGIAKA